MGLGIDSAKPLNNYGSILLREGNDTLAQKQFKKATQLGNAKARKNLKKLKATSKTLAK